MTNQPPDRLDQLAALLEDTAELVLAHDTTLLRIEAAIEQLVTTTAENSDRTNQILEYLFQERTNGRRNQEQ